MAEGGKNACVICLEEEPMVKIESCENCKKAASSLIHHLCLARYVCTKHRLLSLKNGSSSNAVKIPYHPSSMFDEAYLWW